MATGRVRFRIQVPDGVGDIVVGQSGSTAYVDATAFQVKKGNGVFGGGDDVTAIDLVRPSVSRVFTLPNLENSSGSGKLTPSVHLLAIG
jgi:hypothetical protein